MPAQVSETSKITDFNEGATEAYDGEKMNDMLIDAIKAKLTILDDLNF